MAERRCETCEFWGRFSVHSPAAEGLANWGECRRRAPTVMSPSMVALKHDDGTEERLFSAFPQTAEDDWCGEHERKMTEAEQAFARDIAEAMRMANQRGEHMPKIQGGE